MPNTFFISDTHFSHANILTFIRRDGITKVRDFSSVEEMDEHIVSQWNSVVKDKDTVWHLGDVVINRRALKIIDRLNGRKRLVLGNHDIFKNKDYLNAGFEDLHAYRKFDRFMCSHVPVHSDSLGRWGVNVHGHLHTDRVMRIQTIRRHCARNEITQVVDHRYYCVCVEQLDDYTPISLEELNAKLG